MCERGSTCRRVCVDVLQRRLHTAPLTRRRCPANTRIQCVSLSALTLRVVELQTRGIFSLPCKMEVGGGGWSGSSPEKRAPLHRPLTLNV